MFESEECLHLAISCSVTQASFPADAVGIESPETVNRIPFGSLVRLGPAFPIRT